MTATVRRLVRRFVLEPLGGVLPERSRLGYSFVLDRALNRLEPELVHLDRVLGPRRGLALDIGANRGYYSYALARRLGRVVAFEPNPAVVADLLRLGAPNLEVHNVALSSQEGCLDLFVPRVNGVEQHGWASFDRENLPGAADYRVLPVRVATLDSFRLVGVSFVKIDVEGHEAEVLRGAADTLASSRPRVLIEVKARNRGWIFERFSGLGYVVRRLSAGRLVPVDENPGEAENFVFVPEEEV